MRLEDEWSDEMIIIVHFKKQFISDKKQKHVFDKIKSKQHVAVGIFPMLSDAFNNI